MGRQAHYGLIMDSQGRLHMPGFIGDTFEDTGVLKEREARALEARHREERHVEEYQSNRHERRRAAKLERMAAR